MKTNQVIYYQCNFCRNKYEEDRVTMLRTEKSTEYEFRCEWCIKQRGEFVKPDSVIDKIKAFL